MVLLLAVCSFLIWERSQYQSKDSAVASEFHLDPEFLETELYYTQLISEQRVVVEQFDLNDPELKESFRRDLATLDTMYQELKLEYVETSNEAVLEAMIGNLQLRMELLNQQVLILEQIKNEYKMRLIQSIKYSILVVLVSGAGSLWGQVKETKLDQSFNVNSNTRLSIENRFGKVHIDTWNQNKVQAKVEVEVEGNDNGAREVLDRINIDVSESSGEIRIETEIDDSNNKKWRNQRFKINYTISMPKSNPLNVDHRHGDLYINNFDGDLDLELAHGQIVAEELNGKSRISLQHGNGGRIAAIGSGSLEIQHYQRLRLGRLGNLDFEIAHASADIEEAGDLDLGGETQ